MRIKKIKENNKENSNIYHSLKLLQHKGKRLCNVKKYFALLQQWVTKHSEDYSVEVESADYEKFALNYNHDEAVP